MTITKWQESLPPKTADWLLSWVYDATTGDIYTGHDHINIIPEIPNGMEKAMAGEIICGWWVRGSGGVTTRIATDTVDQEYANKQSPIAEKAQKAAMEYWNENGLGEGYEDEYCPECDEYVHDLEEHNDYYHPQEYCEHCDEYYNPEYEDHSGEWCPECGEHVDDLEEHNNDYHFEPEPWMPKEGDRITYKGKQYKVYDVLHDGIHVVPWLPGGMNPYTMKNSWILPWEDYLEDQKRQKGIPEVHPEQTSLENPYPGWIEPKVIQGVPTTPPSYWKTPTGSIKHCVDLHDVRVFAKLSYDYLGVDDDVDWILPEDKSQNGDAISQNSITQPNEETDFTPTPGDDTPSANVSLPDNPAVVDIARDWDSQEYRWSYDGTQLHMWRVYNRSAYGPSHYDMFGHEGYSNHSQGRVYVSDTGKVGMLYWQITHPECERVLNEWCLKTFGKLPDYTYRAYGPYQGKPVSRWDFPIVEVGGLPIKQSERWWEQPGGYPGMKSTQPTYPAPKQKKKKFQIIPGPVDDQGQPITPGKNKRRKRTRNRKYRNRSFRR